MHNVLYYWCFQVHRNDNKPWYDRHKFGRITYGASRIICLLIIFIVTIFLMGAIGDIAIVNLFNFNVITFDIRTYFVYGIAYILNVVETTILISPVPIVYYCIKGVMPLPSTHKTQYVTFSVITPLLSIYDINVLGVILAQDESCNFGSYINFLSCWSIGASKSLIIVGMYCFIAIVGMIIYGIHRCIMRTRRAMENQEARAPQDSLALSA